MVDHVTTIVCNGSEPDCDAKGLFSILPNLQFMRHDNSGKDIGAFISACKQSTADMIVFFGASTYFKREGWLLRMASAFNQFGMAQYGTMGNRGSSNVLPHLRTTGFWMAPELLNSYPHHISSEERYAFEHYGEKCFTQWVTDLGLKNYVITWDGAYLWEEWDSFPEGLHRGTQSAMLCGDRLCEPPYYWHQ